MSASVEVEVRRSAYDDAQLPAEARAIPVEAPIAIEINGIAYAVMMATPADLEDFVAGFVLGEGLAEIGELSPAVIHRMVDAPVERAYVARINLPPHRAEPVMERARRRLGDSSCGLCGIESIQAALRPLPRLHAKSLADAAAIRRGLDELRGKQVLGNRTGATHAAAFCDNTGTVVLVREDIGRHNALDKLIGALARQGSDAGGGFIVVTSRCSYELVEKAVRANCPLLVAISAPTDLAVQRAREAGLSLAVLARDDTMLWVNQARPGFAKESDGGL